MTITLITYVSRALLRLVRRATAWWHSGGPMMQPIAQSVIFGLLLWQSSGLHASWWLSALMCLWVLYSYLGPMLTTAHLTGSALILIITAMTTPGRFTFQSALAGGGDAGGFAPIFFALIFSLLLFALLGLKHKLVLHSRAWYLLLSTSLLYIGSMCIYGVSGGYVGPGSVLAFWLLFSTIVYEYCIFFGEKRTRLALVAGSVVGLLAAESGWAFSLLPISAAYSSSLLTIAVVVSTMTLQRYLRATLTAQFIRRAASAVGIATIIIALLTRWLL